MNIRIHDIESLRSFSKKKIKELKAHNDKEKKDMEKEKSKREKLLKKAEKVIKKK